MKLFKLIKALNINISILIAIFSIFIILQPLLLEVFPQIAYIEFDVSANQPVELLKNPNEPTTLVEIPKDNRLVIPKILVDSSILEGEDESILNKGMWHRPSTSSPDKGGNTVITAHRRLYTSGPNTFYNLDKVERNDDILVYWEGKEYRYKVFEILEVFPEQVEIEDNTKESIITLYTCTPIGSSEKRLVVKANLQ